jgi:nucleoside 2-deoxyribosyltransferase
LTAVKRFGNLLGMNIYLSGSISGGRQKLAVYIQIKEYLESKGHQVTSPQTADPAVTATGEGDPDNPVVIYERDIRQIDSSEAMVAEVTIPSLGVGYEIAYAISKQMPVLCLYDTEKQAHRLSAMIAGNTSPCLTCEGYWESTLIPVLEQWLTGLQGGLPK